MRQRDAAARAARAASIIAELTFIGFGGRPAVKCFTSRLYLCRQIETDVLRQPVRLAQSEFVIRLLQGRMLVLRCPRDECEPRVSDPRDQSRLQSAQRFSLAESCMQGAFEKCCFDDSGVECAGGDDLAEAERCAVERVVAGAFWRDAHGVRFAREC